MSEIKPEGFYSPRFKASNISYVDTNAGGKTAIVDNFPGLLAELNEAEIRAMAASLIEAANKLAELNK